MSFAHVVLFLITAWGGTWVLVASEIAQPLRLVANRVPFFFRLLGCYGCTGFWVGLTLALLDLAPILNPSRPWLSTFAAGIAAAGFARWMAPSDG